MSFRGFLRLLTFEEHMSDCVLSGKTEALLGEVPDFIQGLLGGLLERLV